MLAIFGQTARPNWLKFFEGPHEYPWGNFSKINFFH